MRHHAKLVCSVVFIFSLALAATAGAASPASGEAVEPLLELLRSKGVISVEEDAGLRSKLGSGSGDFKAVIELLQSKGTISKEDAEKLQLRSPVLAEQETTRPVAPVAIADGVLAESVAALPEKEIKPVIEVLREQGVLGVDEASQITERIGRKWSAATEDDRIAATDEEIEYSRTTFPKDVIMSEIVLLRQQAVINDDEAERIRERFLHKLSLERIAGLIDENMRRDLQTQVAEKIVPVPEWTKRIKLSGDFRLRYEGDFFDGSGSSDIGNGIFVKPDKPTEIYNSTIDRHQVRIRARLAVTAKINDEVEVGLGLATGSATNPVSTNATLGDTLNKKSFLLDLGYLKWSPLPSLTLWGGRFSNPWFGSDLVWDQDVNFDGVAFSYKPKFTSSLGMFLTGGAFPIQEIDLSNHDKWLLAGQLGVRYQDEKKLTATLAVAFYDFENVTGKANDPSYPNANDFTAPQFQQKGNTLFDIDPSTAIKTAYAVEYRELNIGGSLDLGLWDPLRVVFMGDYVNNIGYDRAYVNSLTGHDVKRETEGFQFGAAVGYPDTRDFGQWKVLVNYKYLEADAVMDAFAESDFHLGGTNAKGWIFGGDLGVGKNVWLSTRWITTNEISGPPLAIDVFQFNVHARF